MNENTEYQISDHLAFRNWVYDNTQMNNDWLNDDLTDEEDAETNKPF